MEQYQAYTLKLNGSFQLELDVVNSAGQWYHAIATWDGTGMYLYLNNILDNSSTTVVTARDTNANVYIGVEREVFKNPGHKNYPFNGLIDQVTIWNKTLSDTERAYIYNSGTGR